MQPRDDAMDQSRPAPGGEGGAFGTLAVHAGNRSDPVTGAHATPVYQTSTFLLGSVERSGRLFSGEEQGGIYSRIGNPTVAAAEEKLAALEGAETAVAFASGMGAIAATFLSLLNQGDEVLYLGPLYGGTCGLLHDVLGRFGVSARPVSAADLEGAVSERTRMLYVETPTNPTLAVHDLRRVAAVARRHGLLSMVDNTFATPYLTRPLELGIDLVAHSATKYLSGHGDVLGGFVAGRADLLEPVRLEGLRHVGAALDPHAAFLLLRGMRTLHLRMEAHCRNARAVAAALEGAPGVARVHYPGLPSHPDHAVAASQMRDFGGMVSVELHGGLPAAEAFLGALRLIDHAVSLGDVCSLACVPAATTHQLLPEEELAGADIAPGLVRVSVGVEDAADLVADVTRAAQAAARVAAAQA
ncbi:MAG TPA: PLP-dependent aspartate aminotransferase family protein [Trueperaceae bacterium]|nr:PLP-dependent aspartate aminotransferase family protein [Trueperaceae bacterium]